MDWNEKVDLWWNFVYLMGIDEMLMWLQPGFGAAIGERWYCG